jgi:tetratricopeptide (TPR) repeat protein
MANIPRENLLKLVYDCYKFNDKERLSKSLKNIQLQNILLISKSAKSTDDPENIHLLLEHANHQMSLGNYEDVIETYERMIKHDPSVAEYYSGKARAFMILEETEKAFECYNRFIELRPNDSYGYKTTGVIMADKGRHCEAIERLNKAIELDHNDKQLYWTKANSLTELGRYEEAITCVNEASQLGSVGNEKNDSDPGLSAIPDYIKGVCCHKLGRYDDALVFWDKAIKINNDDPEFYRLRGNLLVDMKRFEEALCCYDQAIRFGPDDPENLISKAKTLEIVQKYEEALKCYSSAFDIDPDIVEVEHKCKELKDKIKS